MLKNLNRGNVVDISSNYKDWFIGTFVNHTLFNTLNKHHFEVKWSKRSKGHISQAKSYSSVSEINDEITIGVLIYGKAKVLIDDCTVLLEHEGDYIGYRPNIAHRVEFIEDSLMITFRYS